MKKFNFKNFTRGSLRGDRRYVQSSGAARDAGLFGWTDSSCCGRRKPKTQNTIGYCCPARQPGNVSCEMVDKSTDKRWSRSYARSRMKTDRRTRDILGIIKKTYASLEKRGREREQARRENLEARVVGTLRCARKLRAKNSDPSDRIHITTWCHPRTLAPPALVSL